MATAAMEPAGIIKPDEMYRLEEAKKRTGWGAHAFRAARRAGLQVRYAGRRGFVLGKDIIEYVERTGATSK